MARATAEWEHLATRPVQRAVQRSVRRRGRYLAHNPTAGSIAVYAVLGVTGAAIGLATLTALGGGAVGWGEDKRPWYRMAGYGGAVALPALLAGPDDLLLAGAVGLGTAFALSKVLTSAARMIG